MIIVVSLVYSAITSLKGCKILVNYPTMFIKTRDSTALGIFFVQKWKIELNRSLEDAQRSAEKFINANPEMKKMVGQFEELKGKVRELEFSLGNVISPSPGGFRMDHTCEYDG